ncbi:MAG: TMEM175 family protein [Bacteroidota bacterium]|nr:TMEM175 family protein [Bacteroidota bacterium]
MSATQSELQKEFELERMILFSDAVFAIAITLLIIEIKFPEVPKDATVPEIEELLKPVIIRFLGFILSFFFIGLMWARHLKTFKYLKKYDNGVIYRNLVLLFFIVCFPFTASGLTEHIRPHFLLPILIYIINIACVSVSQFILCSYLFKKKSTLSVDGFETEKNYILLQSKFVALVLVIGVAVVFLVSLIFPGNTMYVLYSFYVVPVMMLFVRKALKKYKPVKPLTVRRSGT